VSWKEATLGISQVNREVNFNLRMEQPALSETFYLSHSYVNTATIASKMTIAAVN